MREDKDREPGSAADHGRRGVVMTARGAPAE